ncbi:MAG: glutamate synthase [Planctomycetes bacterium]|nr:glutamate synthase [Planctomycetota bacterium]
MLEIEGRGKSTRELNRQLRDASQQSPDVLLRHPDARHNLGVGLFRPVRLRIEGSVGYFGAGLCDGPSVDILGNAGWGLGDNLMSGEVLVRGDVGAVAGIGMRGGRIVIQGRVGSRMGQVAKGGVILCCGDAGFMAGYLLMGGTIVILGNAGVGLGECMFSGEIYVGGHVARLGADAVQVEASDRDLEWVKELLATSRISGPSRFQKVVSGKRLHHVDAGAEASPHLRGRIMKEAPAKS